MAPLPPFITRIVATYLAQILSRRLQQSPTFFRIVDRLVHEADHLPHRLQGRPVPPYRSIDPQEPTLREQVQDAWQRQTDDQGEPHDLPDPFAPQNRKASQGAPQSFDEARARRRQQADEAKRQRAREAFAQSQRQSQLDRARRVKEDERIQRDKPMQDLRALLDKMRDEQSKR